MTATKAESTKPKSRARSTFWLSMLGGGTRYVDVNGVSTRVLEAGPQDASKSIIMIHGGGGHAENWVTNIVPLSGAGVHVLAPDLLGHGLSERPTNAPYTFEAMVDQVGRLIDVLGLTDVTLVGLSIGGLVCCHVAVNRPNQVTRLALVCPAGITPNGNADALSFRIGDSLSNHFDRPGLSAVRQRFYRNLHVREALSSEMVALRSRILQTPRARETIVSVWTDYDDRFEFYNTGEDLLKRLDVPTLYIKGALDERTRLATLEKAATLQKDASIKVFEHSGHWPQVEQPEEFHEVLTDFVK